MVAIECRPTNQCVRSDTSSETTCFGDDPVSALDDDSFDIAIEQAATRSFHGSGERDCRDNDHRQT
jgi:hypothetical protein